ncbi:MAG: hypothetical protein K2W96_20810 [Gemmataceae bacterium]|nr:hypothetical protein [Gemmataceae bacterium]
MRPNVAWAAQLGGVREITLLGSADLAFWKERLAREGLVPLDHAGQARVVVIAARLRFMGVSFREASFSVAVRPPEGEKDAAFLLHAYNTCSFFAFCERFLSGTPYHYAECAVEPGCPGLVQVGRGAAAWHRAMLGARPALPEPVADGFDGPVFLPTRRGKGKPGKLFHARLAGPTRRCPFDPALDSLALDPPSRGGDALRALRESGFAGVEWQVREMALHAKSETVARPSLAAR